MRQPPPLLGTTGGGAGHAAEGDRRAPGPGSGARFAVLGPVRAWRDGAEVDLGTPQQRTALAILLLHEGAPVSLTDLVDIMWEDAPPQSAVSTVRTYVSRLRRALGPGLIASARGGYALRAGPGRLDLTLFQDLVTRARTARREGDAPAAAAALGDALGLWKGSPLTGVPGTYAEAQRTRLDRLRLAAAEDRFAIDLELGLDIGVVTELAAMVGAHPLRERSRELLMLALYRAGRQSEALESFRECRRLLAAELGLDPGPGLREMHRRILAADPRLLGPSARGWPAAPPPPAPAQLPADLADFTGRSTGLREVAEALAQPGVPLVGIVGLGGIGKTALAVHAAHAAREAFPGGQLYVDLAATGEPSEPGEVLAAFLRSFGVPGHAIPVTTRERAALWRTTLSGRRVLIVLDDARDSAQIRELLPAAPGSAVIVTGRQRMLDLPGARWLKLDPFAPDEAVALLGHVAGAARVGAEPRAARGLAEACAGIPLSVRLAGARLATRPGWSVAAVERLVREEMRRLTDRRSDCLAADAPLDRGYRRLDAEQARAFRLVAMSEEPEVTDLAAASVLRLPGEMARPLLESLVDVHLMETGSPGRYSYLAPVRAYARRRAVTEDGVAACQAAISRLIDFHVRTGNLSPAARSGAAAGPSARRPEPVADLLLLSHAIGSLAQPSIR
ncbi:AfsR/SARP family transcriptional regulator [Sphaerisporangium corydalis]|uniref:BTAD domain-containing putative transcriptional regulator n=1 Tax=Sphaerisporangium corydalis TaxID=1441875 RepID=A0ABV9ERK4_9ACTN|nr:BTAD domain-containing putative transcriptional regulator [Sphaerisporangium corydalis]